MVIRRIGPLSAARIAALLYAIVGLVLGVIVSLLSVAGAFATEGFAANPTLRPGVGVLFGVGAIVVLPLMYGAFGFVGTLVFTWLYNTLAKVMGGVEIDLQ